MEVCKFSAQPSSVDEINAGCRDRGLPPVPRRFVSLVRSRELLNCFFEAPELFLQSCERLANLIDDLCGSSVDEAGVA